MSTKEKRKITFNTEMLMFLTLALKVVPLKWFYQNIPNNYDVNRYNVKSILTSKVKSGDILVSDSKTESAFVYLSKQGFNKANNNERITYQYSSWNKAVRRTFSMDNLHHYFMFRFLLEFFDKNRDLTKVITDYDKKIKMEFSERGTKVIVKPDMIIVPKEDDCTLALEADTGHESQSIIYDKIVKYLLVSRYLHEKEGHTCMKVYFSFGTQGRLNRIFGEKGTLVKYFQELNTLSEHKSSPINIHIRDVFNILNKDILQIYTGTFEDDPASYKKVDLTKLLKDYQPRWQTM